MVGCLISSFPVLAQTFYPPKIFAVGATNVTESNVVLNASIYRNSGKPVQAWFTWGTTTNLTKHTPTQTLSAGTNAIVITNRVGGLATNRTYCFRCVASNKFGISQSPIHSFITKHDVQFQDLNASPIASDGALLTGTFWAQFAGKSWFRYGFSSNLGFVTPVENFIGTNLVTRTHQLTNLTPNRKYYYRLLASNQFGISGTVISNFTTKLTFSVESVDAFTGYFEAGGQVGVSGLILNEWGLTAWIEWGKDTNHPIQMPPQFIVTSPATPGNILFGLEPNAVYYCRLIGTNIYGRQTTPWKAFRTPTGLSVTTYPSGPANVFPTGPGYPEGIGPVGSTRARLGARIGNYLLVSSDAWFEWGTTTNYENRTPIVVSGFGSFEAFTYLSGLQEAGAIYHYRAVGSNSIGMEFGEDRTFATPLFPLALPSSNLPGVIKGRALWLDYDNDGWMDILVAGETVTGAVCQVWRNDGISFSKTPVDVPPVTQVSFALGDHDNDGRVDVLLAAAGRLEVWHNDGVAFSNINAELPGSYANQGNSVAWRDFNNDGRIDILVEDRLNLLGTNEGVGVWQSKPDGFGFQSLQQLLINGAVSWADYDNDGWLDIAVNGAVYVDRITLWRNTTSGFSRVVPPLMSGHAGSVAWGDYDNDGWLDQLRAGGGVCELWHNTGEGFEKANFVLPPIGDEWTGASAQWGDYDNDGRLDLLVYGYNMDKLPRMDPEFICQIWRNTGTGFTNINAGLPGLWDGSAAWGDYDNDGRLDVLLTGRDYRSGQRFTQIYRNVHVPPNTPPTAPTGLQALRTDFGVAFTWLAANDAQTPSSGLSYNIRVGSAPGIGDIVSANALPDGRRLLLQLGNAQMRRFAYLTGLTNGQTVYWTVQAIDTAFAGGPFATEQSFTYPPSATWSAPALSITPAGATNSIRLAFNSSLPLPFSIYTSTNLISWERFSSAMEGAPGVYDVVVQSRVGAQFYQLRSP